MWSADLPEGNEMAKCRNRVASFLRGAGLDLGCAKTKVCEAAIGIDNAHKADVNIDLAGVDALRIFSDGAFDYVFSSHCLEDFHATDAVLEEWWRVIRPGGHIILYGPDPDYYPRIGTAGANQSHKKDLCWQDVWAIIESFGNAKLVCASRHNESNEYSWQLIVQKRYARLKTVKAAFGKVYEGMSAFPRVRWSRKEALVIRYGALGDMIMITPILRQLKKDGYHVVLNCSEYATQVLKENPNIDEFIVQQKDVIPNDKLDEYWAEISKGFDKVVNLTGTIEQDLLKVQGKEEFNWSHKRRKKECNKNYIDYTMERAGYELKGEPTELFFTEQEERLAKTFLENHKDKFLIVWAMSGSSIHKVYPWAEYVAGTLCQKYGDDTLIVTVGDDFSRMIEWNLPNTLPRCGIFTIRQSMILTKYANLVIGPETGILSAASCYDTPKIIFLSHSSEENLTKYWKNVTALHPEDCRCHPCHKLIYVDTCPSGKVGGRPRCAENIRPETVFKAIETHFKDWKHGRENKPISDSQGSGRAPHKRRRGVLYKGQTRLLRRRKTRKTG